MKKVYSVQSEFETQPTAYDGDKMLEQLATKLAQREEVVTQPAPSHNEYHPIIELNDRTYRATIELTHGRQEAGFLIQQEVQQTVRNPSDVNLEDTENVSRSIKQAIESVFTVTKQLQ